ncbi:MULTISPECIES: PAAR-like domain-containing protein [unclassified Mesorhizobium]|uniref:PAAR-like domain-containing protein n=1 Tax=unclassified Mesorhizobium TaxID=325217 RepID=UPI0008DF45AC|nr:MULTISPECIES: PAAR-like domain-containing protein [unclassified Mesorhizobium]SFT71955.1 GHH signature containing HNH/Endo VII superfamily nuclease toxin 2 [Mesorhizobium sp. YR577]
MSGVFANGLEISGKAVGAKTIAALPDVCFTPPENPATPPGVPIPYPSFGFASDTEQGTGTVTIGGKTVNIKNKSDLTKTSGTEAGCAAKKGVVTSKNTGKEFFKSWSPDVKFDGEPVIRMSDLATNNHASDPPNAPPWPHIAGVNPATASCAEILGALNLRLHRHEDSPCEPEDRLGKTNKDTFEQSDHIVQTACFTEGRDGPPIPTAGPKAKYDINKAPCVCLKDASKRETQHGEKSATQRQSKRDWVAKKKNDASWQPTYKDAREDNLDAMKDALDPQINDGPNGEEHPAVGCLRTACDDYFKEELGMTDDTPVKIPHKSYPAPAVPSGAPVS